MKLTGKCKEDFDKWFNEEQVFDLGDIHNGFYGMQPSCQYGVYVEFFWLNNTFRLPLVHDYMSVILRELDLNESFSQAVERANNTYNNSMINFKEGSNKDYTCVYLGTKRVGSIRHNIENHDGFVYYPLGKTEGGDKFKTLDECKESLL